MASTTSKVSKKDRPYVNPFKGERLSFVGQNDKVQIKFSELVTLVEAAMTTALLIEPAQTKSIIEIIDWHLLSKITDAQMQHIQKRVEVYKDKLSPLNKELWDDLFKRYKEMNH